VGLTQKACSLPLVRWKRNLTGRPLIADSSEAKRDLIPPQHRPDRHPARWTAEIARTSLCLRFVVTGPSATPLPYYRRKVVSTTGQFELVLPPAFSEPPGPYTVRAEEIVTGPYVEATFTVEQPGTAGPSTP